MEATQATSHRVDMFGSIVHHGIFDDHPYEEEHPVPAGRTVNLNRATEWKAIAGISGLIEDAVAVSKFQKRSQWKLNRWLIRSDTLSYLRQVNRGHVEMGCIREPLSSCNRKWHIVTLALEKDGGGTLNNHDFTASLETFLKEKAEKAVDVKWKRVEQCQKFIKAVCSTAQGRHHRATDPDKHFWRTHKQKGILGNIRKTNTQTTIVERTHHGW